MVREVFAEAPGKGSLSSEDPMGQEVFQLGGKVLNGYWT